VQGHMEERRALVVSPKRSWFKQSAALPLPLLGRVLLLLLLMKALLRFQQRCTRPQESQLLRLLLVHSSRCLVLLALQLGVRMHPRMQLPLLRFTCKGLQVARRWAASTSVPCSPSGPMLDLHGTGEWDSVEDGAKTPAFCALKPKETEHGGHPRVRRSCRPAQCGVWWRALRERLRQAFKSPRAARQG